MVFIITKRDGPRREDAAAKRFLTDNRGTIDRLANHLTNGAWSSRATAVPEPLIVPPTRVSNYVPVEAPVAPPIVRISPNNRVVLMDVSTGRQTAFLGEICGGRRDRRFRLATKANGFVAPLAEDMAIALGDLDIADMTAAGAEDWLKATIAERLGLPAAPGGDGWDEEA